MEYDWLSFAVGFLVGFGFAAIVDAVGIAVEWFKDHKKK